MANRSNDGVILDKKDLEGMFEQLASRSAVYGFSKNGREKTICRASTLHELDICSKNTNVSWKRHFFPQTETMLSFDASEAASPAADRQETDTPEQDVLFGVRPCDALAISLMDRVFVDQDPQDPYYAKRRARTAIIAFACVEPGSACFCNSVGGNPDSETGADLMFYELKDRYYVAAVTELGAAILAAAAPKAKAATHKDEEEKLSVMARARESLERRFDASVLAEKLEDFGAEIWETVHRKCLGCGICTYLCPTCHCFDVTDEVVKTHGRRVRTWDSCMFPLFTLHASGHNPRPGTKQRMRQRIMHKFNYAPKNSGQAFCVGCGRCIVNCPVNLDIRTLIEEMAGQR